jgi:hypothetical protein
LQGLQAKRDVVQAGQHHQRDVGRGGVSPPNCFQSLHVGQSQVEQDNVNRMFGKIFCGVGHALDVDQFAMVRSLRDEHFADYPGISVIIFDQENFAERFCHRLVNV